MYIPPKAAKVTSNREKPHEREKEPPVGLCFVEFYMPSCKASGEKSLLVRKHPMGRWMNSPWGAREIHLFDYGFKSSGVKPCLCRLKAIGEDKNSTHLGSTRAIKFTEVNT